LDVGNSILDGWNLVVAGQEEVVDPVVAGKKRWECPESGGMRTEAI
jgi:hypothetical protein